MDTKYIRKLYNTWQFRMRVPQDMREFEDGPYIIRTLETGGVAAGKGLPHELEVPQNEGDVNPLPAEFFHEVERDVRFPLREGGPDVGELFRSSQELRVVAQLLECGDHVVFGFPGCFVFFGQPLHAVGEFNLLVCQDEHARHNGTQLSEQRRSSMTSAVRSIKPGRRAPSSLAARRSSSRQRLASSRSARLTL